MRERPWGDSNTRTRLRRPVLYPLSYRGSGSIHYSRGLLGVQELAGMGAFPDSLLPPMLSCRLKEA